MNKLLINIKVFINNTQKGKFYAFIYKIMLFFIYKQWYYNNAKGDKKQ